MYGNIGLPGISRRRGGLSTLPRSAAASSKGHGSLIGDPNRPYRRNSGGAAEGLLRGWWIEQGDLLARADLGPQYVFTNSVLSRWDPGGIDQRSGDRTAKGGYRRARQPVHAAPRCSPLVRDPAGGGRNGPEHGRRQARTFQSGVHACRVRALRLDPGPPPWRSRRRRGRPVGLTAR
jgi:hypothetical protein